MKNKCCFCGSSVELMANDFIGYKEDLVFEIYRCNGCLASFPEPKIDASRLYDVIYKDTEVVPGYGRYWAYFNVIKEKKNPLQFLANSEEAYWGVKEALKSFESNSINDLKFLEIGSGLGYLTYALRQDKYNVVGLDVSEEAVNKANEHFGEYFLHVDLFDFVLEKPNNYDIVILTEVIEHVENPTKFIEAIFKLLRPDGKIILTTPNKSIAPKDIVWDSESPPIHHWWFTEESIEFISKGLNASTTFIDFTSYYRKKPKRYKPNKIRKNQYREPIIGKDWQLIRKSEQKHISKAKAIYKGFVRSLGGIKYVIFSVVSKMNPQMILCSKRGMILCAVLQKNKTY